MTVVYINAVQYQTCPNHESDNHFFAKIPGGGGGGEGGSGPPVPPLWICPCGYTSQGFLIKGPGSSLLVSMIRNQ